MDPKKPLLTDSHGGRIFEAARLLGRPWRDIIDFSANINPFGQPDGLKKHLFEQFSSTLHYPEEKAQSFTQALSQFYQVNADHFLPGAGSTVHIYLLARLLGLKGQNVIVGPAFSEYEAALKAAGANYVYVNALEKDNFLVNRRTLEDIFNQRPRVIFLANPANPTGQLIAEEIMEELLTETQAKKIYLVVDEAFIDFTDQPSLTPQIEKYPYLAILRSLTKIMAVPGLRLAYLVAAPDLVHQLWSQLGPWPLSSLAIAAGLYHLNAPFDQVALNQKILALAAALNFATLSISQSYPSRANYGLFKLRAPERVDELIHFFFQHNLLVRDARNFPGLRPGWLRLAVRPAQEIETLAQLVEKFHA
ncbi:MAG: aminotransferase class I/II-fold pyridoxal phosphate-dependent enzyme [Deltaproteobacteria bacterium]|jgi:threonine-phosphate decarboxylase|nr:aminotransferase class I/II-fold pyridoxal phosphate-dependent enzyme [Deltaproteobacteria bacterium]